MAKNLLLVLAAATGVLLLVGCPVAGPELPDLSDLLRFRTDLAANEWNEGHDAYYNQQWYSYACLWSSDPSNPSPWPSDEDLSASFAVVSWVDEESDDYLERPTFLRVEQGYGYTKFGWRIYGVDPELSVDNGFTGVEGEVVNVSIDVWVPDIEAALDQNGWLHVAALGTAALANSVSSWNYTIAAGDVIEKYDGDPGTIDDAAGTGGWVTLTKDVTLDANGVVDVYIKMANQDPVNSWVAYFDNLEVTYVSGP